MEGGGGRVLPGQLAAFQVPSTRQARVIVRSAASGVEPERHLRAFALQSNPWLPQQSQQEEGEAPEVGSCAAMGQLPLHWRTATEARLRIGWPELRIAVFVLAPQAPGPVELQVDWLEERALAPGWELFRRRVLAWFEPPGAGDFPEFKANLEPRCLEQLQVALPGGCLRTVPEQWRELLASLLALRFSRHWMEEAPLTEPVWQRDSEGPDSPGACWRPEGWADEGETYHRVTPGQGLPFTVKGPCVLRVAHRGVFLPEDATPYLSYTVKVLVGKGERLWRQETRPDHVPEWLVDPSGAPTGVKWIRRIALPPGSWKIAFHCDRPLWVSMERYRLKPLLAEGLAAGGPLLRQLQQAQRLLAEAGPDQGPAEPWLCYARGLYAEVVHDPLAALREFEGLRRSERAPRALRLSAAALSLGLLSEGSERDAICRAWEDLQALGPGAGKWELVLGRQAGIERIRAAATLAEAQRLAASLPGGLGAGGRVLEVDLNRALAQAMRQDPSRAGMRPLFVRPLLRAQEFERWKPDHRQLFWGAWFSDTYWRPVEPIQIRAQAARKLMRPSAFYRRDEQLLRMRLHYAGVLGRMDEDYVRIPPGQPVTLAGDATPPPRRIALLAQGPQPEQPWEVRLSSSQGWQRPWGILFPDQRLRLTLPPEQKDFQLSPPDGLAGQAASTVYYGSGLALTLGLMRQGDQLGWRRSVFYPVGDGQTPGPRLEPLGQEAEAEGAGEEFVRATFLVPEGRAGVTPGPPAVRILLDGRPHQELLFLKALAPDSAASAGGRFFTWDFAIPAGRHVVEFAEETAGRAAEARLWVQLSFRRCRSKDSLLAAPPATQERMLWREEPVRDPQVAQEPALGWKRLEELSGRLSEPDLQVGVRVALLRERALLLSLLRSPVRARAGLLQALDLLAAGDPARVRLLLDLAELELEWGAAEDSSLYLEELLRQRVYGARVAQALGMLLAQRGEWALAQAHFQEAWQSAGPNGEERAQAALGLALVARRNGDREGCQRHLAEARPGLRSPRRSFLIALRLQVRLLLDAGLWGQAGEVLAEGLKSLGQAADEERSRTYFEELLRIQRLQEVVSRLPALQAQAAGPERDLALAAACEVELFASPLESWEELEPYDLTRYPSVLPCYLEQTQRHFLYYAVRPEEDLAFEVLGPARLRLAVRPDHPLTPAGPAASAEVHFRLGVSVSGCGEERFLMVGSQPSSRVRYPSSAGILPGRRVMVEVRVPPGRRQVRVRSLMGNSHIRPLVQQADPEEALLAAEPLTALDFTLRAFFATLRPEPEPAGAARLAELPGGGKAPGADPGGCAGAPMRARLALGLVGAEEVLKDPALLLAAGRFEALEQALGGEQALSVELRRLRGLARYRLGRYAQALADLPDGVERTLSQRAWGEELVAGMLSGRRDPLDSRILQALSAFEALPEREAADPLVGRCRRLVRGWTATRGLTRLLGDAPLRKVRFEQEVESYELSPAEWTGMRFNQALVAPAWRESGMLVPREEGFRLDFSSPAPIDLRLQFQAAEVFYEEGGGQAEAVVTVREGERIALRERIRLDRLQAVTLRQLPAGPHRLHILLEYDAEVWRVRMRILGSLPLTPLDRPERQEDGDWHCLLYRPENRYTSVDRQHPADFQMAGPSVVGLSLTRRQPGAYGCRVQVYEPGRAEPLQDLRFLQTPAGMLRAQVDEQAAELAAPVSQFVVLPEQKLYRIVVRPEEEEPVLVRARYRTLVERLTGFDTRDLPAQGPAAEVVEEPEPAPSSGKFVPRPKAEVVPDLIAAETSAGRPGAGRGAGGGSGGEEAVGGGGAVPLPAPSDLAQDLEAPEREADAEEAGKGVWAVYGAASFEDADEKLDDRSAQDWVAAGFEYGRRFRAGGEYFGARLQGRWLEDVGVGVGDLRLDGYLPIPLGSQFGLTLRADGHLQEETPGIPAAGTLRGRLSKTWDLPLELDFKLSLEAGRWGSTVARPTKPESLKIAYEIYSTYREAHEAWLTPRGVLRWKPFRDLNLFSGAAAVTNRAMNPHDLDRYWIRSGVQGFQHGLSWTLQHTYLVRRNDWDRSRASQENELGVSLTYERWASRSHLVQPWVDYDYVPERESHSILFGVRVILGGRGAQRPGESAPGTLFQTERDYHSSAP